MSAPSLSPFTSPAAPPPPEPAGVLPHGPETPATREVPQFPPVRVRGGRFLPHGFVQRRRRALVLGLAMTAAALVAAGPRSSEGGRGHPGDAPRTGSGPVADAGSGRPAAPAQLAPPAPERAVAAPVRIADAETVRLLRSGDRVDVIAADESASGGGPARYVARGALVSKVPEPLGASAGGGALVVLSVPRSTAAGLAGAGVTARLAVTLW